MQGTSYYPQGYQANGSTILSASLSLPPTGMTQTGGQPVMKRKQVKNACTNCQKACKKCDDTRPCPRCQKYGIADTCVNSVRKERKKGIKRGPYKRRYKIDQDKQEQDTKSQKIQPTPQHPTGQFGQEVRPNPVAFGYPSNLGQYGQSYDTYSPYTGYHKDQMISHPYVVNSVYPAFGYSVVLQTNNGNPLQEHSAGVTSEHNTLFDKADAPDSGKPASPGSQSSPQNAPTTVTGPSTPTSTVTASTPGSAEDDDALKYERLSQLCTAALKSQCKD